MSKKYIHYGSAAFDPEMWHDVKNGGNITKPTGGLWASPIDAEFGWREWNAESHFKKCYKENSFIFSLSERANVVRIHTMSDLDKLPQIEREYPPTVTAIVTMIAVDFEKCVEEGIDAIELCTLENGLYWALYGWDCESIIILNKDIIEFKEE